MRSDQHGIILVLVLLCMTLLAAAGIGLAMSSSVSRMSAANHEESVMLLNAAESALALAARELGRYRLDEILSGARQSTLVDGIAGLRTIAPGTTINLNALTNHLTCGRPTPCTDLQRRQVTRERPWGGNNPRWRLFIHQPLNVPASLPVSTPPVYVVVWLGDDAREEDDDPDTDGAGPAQEGRYILRARAEAFGPRAGRRAIEAELVRMCTTQAESESCLPGSRVQSWRAVSAQIP